MLILGMPLDEGGNEAASGYHSQIFTRSKVERGPGKGVSDSMALELGGYFGVDQIQLGIATDVLDERDEAVDLDLEALLGFVVENCVWRRRSFHLCDDQDGWQSVASLLIARLLPWQQRQTSTATR